MSDPTDPDSVLRAAEILIERTRLLGERAEDARRLADGEPLLERDATPTDRITYVAAAEEQLKAEAAAAQLTRLASEARQANLDRIAAMQIELNALLLATGEVVPMSNVAPPGHAPAPSVRFDIPTTETRGDGRPTGTVSDLLGEFLTVERTQVELEYGSMQVISKADRLKLSASDKSKIYAAFSKGITSKFKASSTIVGLDEISTIENIMSFAQLRLELQKHVTGVSAHPVFLILKFNSAGTLIDPDSAAGAPTNLLSANVMPRIEEVEKSTFYHYKRGSAFNQENLAWSYEAIRNSCDKDLQAIIDAKMLKYQALERFGPLFYYELVQQMTTVDSKAVRAITQELTSLKVVDQEGQSIAKTAKIIRSTIIWLEMVRMLPPDIDAIVYDILETCHCRRLPIVPEDALHHCFPQSSSYDHERTVGTKRKNTIALSFSRSAGTQWGHQGSSFQAQRTPISSTPRRQQ